MASRKREWWTDSEIRIAGGDWLGPTPPRVRDALIKALYEATEYPWIKTSYPETEGVPVFRKAIADYYYRRWNVEYDPGQILPTCGSTPAYTMILDCYQNNLWKAGDEVILTDPSFSSYFGRMAQIGLKVVPLPCKRERWHFDPEELRKVVTEKTKIMIICTPNNPTGTVYTKEELAALEDIAEENDLYVLSDEIYQEFVFDGKSAILPEQFKGLKERTFIANSISKIANATGWRLGFIIAPEKLYPKILRYSLDIGSHRPPTFVQVAGAAVYKEPLDYVDEIRKEYEKRRNFFVPRINEIEGLSCPMFEGAFYAFVDIRPLGIKPAEFVNGLNKTEKVTIQNGESHGVQLCKGHVRVALREPVSVLEEACNKIERFVKTIKK